MTEQLHAVRIGLSAAGAIIFIFVSSGALGVEGRVSPSVAGLTLVTPRGGTRV
jgi:hypothetical protein